MNKEEIKLILELLDLSIKYGVPIVKEMIENSNKTTITTEDIENLKINKEWDSYFK